jgi:putative membrane protein
MTGGTPIDGLLADAADAGHMGQFGWSMMAMGWQFMLIIVGLVVWAVIQAGAKSPKPHDKRTGSAQRILADRFARGEIDEEEYRSRSGELDG